MKTYSFTLTGQMPLIMHRDEVLLADEIAKERKGKKSGDCPAGDDRFPARTWQTYLYTDGENIVMPWENISKAVMTAGKTLKIGKKSMKEASVCHIHYGAMFFEFLNNGALVPIAPIESLASKTFPEQVKGAEKLGIKLLVKRVTIGTSKHVRVRPVFDNWQVRGTIRVNDSELSTANIKDLFEVAGMKGLGDWRPSAPKSPGPFGTFSAEIK